MTNFIHENTSLVLLLLGPTLILFMIFFLRRPERGLYMTFFFTGILITPHLPVVRDKFTAGELFMLLTWFILISYSRDTKNQAPLSKAQINVMLLGAAFITWTIITYIVNGLIYTAAFTDSANSLIETCNFIYGYMMFLTVVFLVRNWDLWKQCLNSWLWGSVVVSFFGVLALAGHGPSWSYDAFTHRVCSTLRTENQVPSFLLPIFVVLIFMIVQKGRKYRERFALTVLEIGVFLTAIGTGSRTAFLMLMVAGAGIIYVASREARFRSFNSNKLAKLTTFAFFIFLLYLAICLVGYRGDYSLGHTPAWQRPVVMFFDWIEGNRNLDENRTRQLEFVSENIGDNLVFGTGPKNYGDLYGIEEIHNTYVGVLFQMGVPGLLFFLAWLWGVVHIGWKASKRIQVPEQRLIVLCMVVGMGLLLLYSLTMFGLRQRNIWLLAGLLVSADSLVPRRKKAPTLTHPSSGGQP